MDDRKKTVKTMALPTYLYSGCNREICLYGGCPEAVKQNPETGRWFITINHAGFNTPANNGTGYATKRTAVAAFHRYATA